MNLVAVATVVAIVLGHMFNKRVNSLNSILFCFNNSSQITNKFRLYINLYDIVNWRMGTNFQTSNCR